MKGVGSNKKFTIKHLEQKHLEIYIVGKPYESIKIEGKQEYHRDIIFKRKWFDNYTKREYNI